MLHCNVKQFSCKIKDLCKWVFPTKGYISYSKMHEWNKVKGNLLMLDMSVLKKISQT